MNCITICPKGIPAFFFIYLGTKSGGKITVELVLITIYCTRGTSNVDYGYNLIDFTDFSITLLKS